MIGRLDVPKTIRGDYWLLDGRAALADSNDSNPRKNDAAVDRMCASLREFGFKIPCLVRSDGEVVDGHLRLKAAQVGDHFRAGDPL
jgi:ParB-like nuclease domain